MGRLTLLCCAITAISSLANLLMILKVLLIKRFYLFFQHSLLRNNYADLILYSHLLQNDVSYWNLNLMVSS